MLNHRPALLDSVGLAVGVFVALAALLPGCDDPATKAGGRLAPVADQSGAWRGAGSGRRSAVAPQSRCGAEFWRDHRHRAEAAVAVRALEPLRGVSREDARRLARLGPCQGQPLGGLPQVAPGGADWHARAVRELSPAEPGRRPARRRRRPPERRRVVRRLPYLERGAGAKDRRGDDLRPELGEKVRSRSSAPAATTSTIWPTACCTPRASSAPAATT